MRTVLAILVFIIIVGALALGYVTGVAQKPIPLPGKLPDLELPSFAEEGRKLQGLWKVEQILAEDENGNLKTIVQSAPGTTENYFMFEKGHVCTEGNLDIFHKPQPCRFYTTYSVKGDTITIDQPGKPSVKGTWTITGDTLELVAIDQNGKKSKIILQKLPK